MDEIERVTKAVHYIKKRIPFKPQIGLILGSGLGVLATEVSDAAFVPYSDIPRFPVSTVEGHKGRFVLGTLAGKKVIAMQGRFHFYEGYSLKDVTRPVRVMKALGVRTFIVTNASGGINETFSPGDLMLISDHLNMTFQNPLTGPNVSDWGPRFPDLSEAYDKELRALAKRVAEKEGISLQEGVYAGVTGPSYETPAEIRMLRKLGADAVGMSTVPEVIVARHSGMKVLGISCITNMAAGILNEPLSHQEVVQTAERVRNTFSSLVKRVVAEIK